MSPPRWQSFMKVKAPNASFTTGEVLLYTHMIESVVMADVWSHST